MFHVPPHGDKVWQPGYREKSLTALMVEIIWDLPFLYVPNVCKNFSVARDCPRKTWTAQKDVHHSCPHGAYSCQGIQMSTSLMGHYISGPMESHVIWRVTEPIGTWIKGRFQGGGFILSSHNYPEENVWDPSVPFHQPTGVRLARDPACPWFHSCCDRSWHLEGPHPGTVRLICGQLGATEPPGLPNLPPLREAGT